MALHKIVTNFNAMLRQQSRNNSSAMLPQHCYNLIKNCNWMSKHWYNRFCDVPSRLIQHWLSFMEKISTTSAQCCCNNCITFLQCFCNISTTWPQELYLDSTTFLQHLCYSDSTFVQLWKKLPQLHNISGTNLQVLYLNPATLMQQFLQHLSYIDSTLMGLYGKNCHNFDVILLQQLHNISTT